MEEEEHVDRIALGETQLGGGASQGTARDALTDLADDAIYHESLSFASV